jgi:Cyclin, N-terminal domain/Cyclin, C-terminal domain
VTCSFGFPVDFALIAMNYFDRMLSRSNSLSRSKSEIQLLALTCFYLSVKLFQAGPILSIEQIAMISGFAYTSKEIASMEQTILHELKWCLYPPLTTDFLKPYLKILLSDTCFQFDIYYNEILNLAQQMANMVVMDYYFVAKQFLPSHVAAAIIINAISTVLPFSDLSTAHEITHVLSHVTGYPLKENEVFLCCERLWGLVNITNQTKVEATRFIPFTSNSAQIDYRPRSPTPHSPVAVSSSIALHGKNDAHFNKTIERSSLIEYNLLFSRHVQRVPNEPFLRI